MDPKLSAILDLAWRSVPAAQANQAILAARRATAAGELAARQGRLEDEGAEEAPPDDASELARSYELVLPDGATFDSFVRDALPRLVYHLESIGAHLPRAAGVVICAFAGDRLHFLQARELIDKVCELMGVTSDELVQRYGTGESRAVAAPKGPVLQLPGPKGGNGVS